MTITDIKKEALKLMFTNQDNEIDTQDIDTLASDENYGDYLNNMNGSINRALVRLKSKGVEYKGQRLTDKTNEAFDLSWEEEIDGEITKFSIDEALKELIPYFIKGELYEEDNPQQASIAKNYFEDAVDDYLSTKNQRFVDIGWRMDV